MVFSSEVFLFLFLSVTIVFYYLFNDRVKNVWLLAASLFFYAWGEPVYVILMILSIAVNYICALLIDKNRERKNLGKALLILSCVFNIGMLGVFKYTGFFIKNLNRIGFSFDDPGIALPIGISFYTFQALSYVIDVYRNNVAVQKNILKLGLYISMFPQLIAGPIVRYSDIEREMTSHAVCLEDFYEGAKRFMFGFAKKVVIADRVCVIADSAFSAGDLSMNMAWIGIIAYTIQIYFDFSGYSDMAIGLGRIFGFHFPENFNYPYISKSVKEFWRRWHISLSSWFKDYVYIPLGGSRVSKPRTYFNLMVVFLLTGFWHGASWNFIVWGLWYAIFLVAERLLGSKYDKIPSVIKYIYTLLVVIVGWVFFRADGTMAALRYIKAMLSFRFDNSPIIYVSSESLTMLIIGIILSLPLYKFIEKKTGDRPWVTDVLAVLCFFAGIMYMAGSGFSPFLYFRF